MHEPKHPASPPTPSPAGAATSPAVGKGIRVIMAGPPGAGKTTQGERLARRHGVPLIGMGDLLRSEVNRGSELGLRVAAMLTRGDLVPADIAETCMSNRLREPDVERGFVLDGFPRRSDDAEVLERFCHEHGLPSVGMVLIDVDEAEVLRRVEGRRVCDHNHAVDIRTQPPREAGRCDRCGLELKRRSDDTPETLAHRFEVYHHDTGPVVEARRKQGLLRVIDGRGSVDEIEQRVLNALGATDSA